MLGKLMASVNPVAAIASGASAAINQRIARSNADRQNRATLEMMQLAPHAQMEGFRKAGLNPMLAYRNIEFPGSSANIASAPVNFASDQSSVTSAQAAKEQADIAGQRMVVDVQKVVQEIENLRTENERARYLIDVAREQYQNQIKEGYNLTEVGNNLRATINQIRAQTDVLQSQQFGIDLENELKRFEVKAASDFAGMGQASRQLKPFFDILRGIFGTGLGRR